MEYNSEVESLSQCSISSSASSTRCREEIISPEKQALLESLQKGISETNAENVAFTKEISVLLRKLNLEPQTLPHNIKEGLQKVSLILRSQKLCDFDDTIANIVTERRKIEEKKKHREEKKLSLMHDDLFRKHTMFSKKLNHLQEAVNSLELLIENTKKDQGDAYCNTMLLSTKLNEYQQTVNKLEEDVLDLHIEDLYPEKILTKYQRYVEMSGELAELNQALNYYENLPPNLLQAKALLEMKRKEYNALEKEFLEKTNS